MGRAVPRPGWILVIPADRRPDGSLSIWDGDSEWGRSWRVPEIVGNLRIVSLTGDSQDRRTITAQAFDDMEIAPIEAVLRKYGAPAMALAVSGAGSSAVALYVPGYPATWLPVEPGADVASTRVTAVETIVEMTSGSGAAAPSQVDATGQVSTPDVAIVAFRDAGDGYSSDLRIEIFDGSLVVPVLQSFPEVAFLDYVDGDPAVATVRVRGTPAEFESLLLARGLSLAP